MLRLFAAIAVPWDIAQGLAEHQTGLNGAHWRTAEQLHITLRFVGGVAENRADDLDAELSAIAQAPFDLTLTGVGHFGEPQDIHAIWAGVAESAPLTRLHRACESAARRGSRRTRRPWRRSSRASPRSSRSATSRAGRRCGSAPTWTWPTATA